MGSAMGAGLPLAPGSRLGVVGGGQLGHYFVLAARRLGFLTAVLDPDPGAPAMQLGEMSIVARYDDPLALDRLAEACGAITTEFENVPAATLERLAQRRPVFPRAAHVAIAQDRRLEKRLAAEHGLDTARWQPIEDEASAAAPDAACLPGILKSATLGYDGKGQCVCRTAQDVLTAFREFGGVACVLEERLALSDEISVIVARDCAGVSAVYPPAANEHRDGILHTSTVPSGVAAPQLARAVEHAVRLSDAIDYVGVLAVEFFLVGVGESARLLFNEMAPRPHNSGHWTLDACQTSQFEQQVRVLAGWPLGGVGLLSPVSMLNLLGDPRLPDRMRAAVRRHGVALHLYGKREARPSRKMGHANCLASDAAQALMLARAVHDVDVEGEGEGEGDGEGEGG